METTYKNKNRGYQQLRVWHDAIEERKQLDGDWIDHLVVKESNIAYGGD